MPLHHEVAVWSKHRARLEYLTKRTKGSLPPDSIGRGLYGRGWAGQLQNGNFSDDHPCCPISGTKATGAICSRSKRPPLRRQS